MAISAATFVGALGAVALTAAPASAHDATLVSTTECVAGKPDTAKVTWTLTNTWRQRATVGNVVLEFDGGSSAAAVGDIADKATVKKDNGTLVGSKEFSTKGKPPTLKANVAWPDRIAEDVGNEAVWPQGNCAEPPKKPSYTYESTCQGLTITIVNTSDATRKFAVNGSDGDFKEVEKDLKVGEKWVVKVPAENARKVAVKWKLAEGGGKWENPDDKRIDWVKPDTCFDVVTKSTCEGLEITVKNTGAKDIKATATVGDQSKETVIKPDADDSIKFDGVDGLVVQLSINGGKPQEIAWTKPTDCGGPLPTTGVNAGLLAGGALVLVSGGGGLFYLARRRRIRFAA